MTIKAAGVLFVTPDKQALYLKRGAGGDYPGYWCFPGGHVEDGESTLAAAERKTIEEIGGLPEGERAYLTRRITPPQNDANATDAPPEALQGTSDRPVDFTTFIQEVPAPFDVTISGEHVGWAWAPIDQPPEPVHPGCSIALRRISMNELQVAQSIADRELTSPQRLSGFSLFAIRITGTGVAYRRAKTDGDGKVLREEEFCFRAPENYLNPEFLARCNGLPVIFDHPAKGMLNSEEYGQRSVGTIVCPHIRGNEVWGIARIYDDEVISLLLDEQMSTSPGVVLRDILAADKMTLSDGATLLIEGEPALLDHIAICQRGVWDKGGAPAGVESATIGDTDMTEEEKMALAKKEKADQERKDAEEKEKADRARMDADAGKKLDMMLEHLGNLGKRMDAMEECMDKSRKDSEEEEAKAKAEAEEKAKKDAEAAEKVKADSDAAIAARIARLEGILPRNDSDDDKKAKAAAQFRADSAYQAFGQDAPAPMRGEDVADYRRRLIAPLQKHSKAWGAKDLVAINDSVLDIAEEQIFADAMVAAKSASDVPEGQLREVTTVDRTTGIRSTNFYGPNTFIRGMSRQRGRLTGVGFLTGKGN
jgi:8-oxo-dGTP pyrophosphatase MutT (NUDIX family)